MYKNIEDIHKCEQCNWSEQLKENGTQVYLTRDYSNFNAQIRCRFCLCHSVFIVKTSESAAIISAKLQWNSMQELIRKGRLYEELKGLMESTTKTTTRRL